MPSIAALADTLLGLAKPSMKPKELLAAVREQHPESTKKEIVRAAFYALTEGHRLDPEQANGLHGFALNERSAEEEPPIKRRNKKLGKVAREAPAS